MHAMLGSSTKAIYRLLPDLEVVRLPSTMPVEAGLQIFAHDPDVLYAQPDYKYHLDDGPNDPLEWTLWGLNNTGLDNGTIGADISALKAWQLTTGNSNVVVGDIDTGIDYLHPDLVPNLYYDPNGCTGNDDCWGLDAVGDGDMYDYVGHGTHTAGTIGAVGNNGIGVSGVNWSVTLLPCKFLSAGGDGGSDSDAIACLDYMATMKDSGYNIVATNNSWGGGSPSQALYDAIQAQIGYGILFIAAAGNNGADNDLLGEYPATFDLPNIISVAASDRTDQMATFSDYGVHTVHLSAPGVGTVSTYPPETYEMLSGTSMATPHVTGVAALLAAYDSTLDWRAIKNRILAGGDDVPALAATITGKRLDAYGALTCTNSEVLARQAPRNGGIAVAVGGMLKISALHINCGSPAGDVDVDIEPGGTVLTLHDDGNPPDQVAGDGVYSAYYAPPAAGQYTATLPNGDSFTIFVLKTYNFSSNSYNYRTITGANLNLQDETVATLATPFPIHFGGQTFSTLYVGDNGLISFDHPFNVAPALSLPCFEGGAFVAPWWDDLQPLYPSSQNVFWDVAGTAPNRELVIEWRNVPHYFYTDGDGGVTFQVVFSESKDDVVFNYADVNFESTWYQYSGAALGLIGIQTDPSTATFYEGLPGCNCSGPKVADQSSVLWQTVDLDFLLGPPTPAQLTIADGGSQSFSVQVSAVGPLNRSVQLACTGLPAGATCSVSPTPISPVEGTPVTVTVTVSVATGAAPPDFAFTLAATVADLAAAKTQSVAVHVNPVSDFVLTGSVSSYTLAAWASGSFQVNVGSQDGYSGAPAFTCLVAPAGPACSVSPASITAPGELLMTVSGNGAASSMGYQITLQGSDGALTHSLVIPLAITDYTVGSDLQVNIDQDPVSTHFFIYPANGYRGALNLACDASALPGKPACTTQPSQASFANGQDASVLVTISGVTYTPGTYPVNLLTTPAAGGPTRATSMPASILGVSMAIPGPEPTVTVGQSTTFDLLISSTVPIAAGMDLSVFSCGYLITCSVSPSHVNLTGSPVHATVTLDYPVTAQVLSAGDAQITIFGDISSPSYHMSVETTVHRQDFALVAPPQQIPTEVSEIDVILGEQTSTAFTLQESGGLNVPVTVECSQDLPPGMTCQFDRSPVGAGEFATLTIAAASTMDPGQRYVDLIATATINGQQIQHVLTQLVRLGTFTVWLDPDTLSLPVGGEGVYYVYSSNDDYISASGTLSCSSPDAGVVCEAPLWDSINNETYVTVRSTPGITPIGPHPFTVTLTALGESQTTQGTLNVQGTNAIVVTAPNGYELWTSGSQNIIWQYYGDPGPTVKIELLNNGAVVQTIADQVPIGSGGVGAYTWAIPDSLPFSQYYKVRITSDTLPTATDDSDDRVFIGRGVDFADNMAGYVWYIGGGSIYLEYVTSGAGAVQLELYKAGNFLQNITTGGGTSLSAPWKWTGFALDMPNNATPGTDYSFRLVPTNYPNLAVMSPNFTISDTSITIVSPKLNDVYQPGDTVHIQWTWIGNPVSPGSDLTLTCCSNYLDERAAPLGAGGSGGFDWVIPAGTPSSSSNVISLQANTGFGSAQSPNFWIGQAYTITVLPPTGGQVQALDASLLCGDSATSCSAMYLKDSTVTLVAYPDNGYGFTGWSGACSGTGNCVIQLEANSTVGASFADVSSFALSGVDLSTKTVAAGQPAQYSFTVTPGPQLQNDISFRCLGLPMYSSCAFTPATVAKTSGKTTVGLTIATQMSSSAQLRPPLRPTLAAALSAVCLLFGQVFVSRLRLRKLLWWVSFVVGVLALAFVVSCGGGSSSGGGTQPPPDSAPPGNYTITISATAGPMSNSATVQLIVQ
jgi:hypothetical protein